ncbi:MAG: alkaline phosphatase family protein [Roseimicrobium sp.]
MPHPIRLASLFLALAVLPLHAERRAEHVIIVSIDGGKPSVIAESEMPVLKRLASEGAVTWVANTIFPPKTLPSHSSMLTGVGPAQHGVDWNTYMPIRGKVRVPTIFTLARQHDASISTVLFAGKVKFRHLWQPDSLDHFDLNGPQEDKPVPATAEVEATVFGSQAVAQNASAYLAKEMPMLSFVHLADPDTVGHQSGWGSPEQKEAFKVTDLALGGLMQSLQTASIAQSTVIIISADHGGHGLNHGENIPEDMNIPWIAWGQGVKKNHTIARPVTTYDTAATALWLLGVPLPKTFDGKPVTEAFE